ncbi:MAG: hypothetical protein AAGE92_08795 [Cyanobacteria bacterium P01_G01_bin.4]
MKRTFVSFGLAAVLSIAVLSEARVVAQDFSYIGYNGVMTRILHRQQMRSIYGNDLYDRSGSDTWQSNSRQTPSQPSSAPQPAAQVPQIQTLAYQPDPAITQSGQDAFIQRVNEYDPEVGQQLETEFLKHDAIEVYSGIAEPFGLEINNPAHSLAAYSILAWLIANGETANPDLASVAAVSERMEQVLGQDASMAVASDRQLFDEEAKYLFVAMHAGWQSSLADGGALLAQYSDQVNQIWEDQFGQDLRQLALTQQGFERR